MAGKKSTAKKNKLKSLRGATGIDELLKGIIASGERNSSGNDIVEPSNGIIGTNLIDNDEVMQMADISANLLENIGINEIALMSEGVHAMESLGNTESQYHRHSSSSFIDHSVLPTDQNINIIDPLSSTTYDAYFNDSPTRQTPKGEESGDKPFFEDDNVVTDLVSPSSMPDNSKTQITDLLEKIDFSDGLNANKDSNSPIEINADPYSVYRNDEGSEKGANKVINTMSGSSFLSDILQEKNVNNIKEELIKKENNIAQTTVIGAGTPDIKSLVSANSNDFKDSDRHGIYPSYFPSDVSDKSDSIKNNEVNEQNLPEDQNYRYSAYESVNLARNLNNKDQDVNENVDPPSKSDFHISPSEMNRTGDIQGNIHLERDKTNTYAVYLTGNSSSPSIVDDLQVENTLKTDDKFREDISDGIQNGLEISIMKSLLSSNSSPRSFNHYHSNSSVFQRNEQDEVESLIGQNEDSMRNDGDLNNTLKSNQTNQVFSLFPEINNEYTDSYFKKNYRDDISDKSPEVLSTKEENGADASNMLSRRFSSEGEAEDNSSVSSSFQEDSQNKDYRPNQNRTLPSESPIYNNNFIDTTEAFPNHEPFLKTATQDSLVAMSSSRITPNDTKGTSNSESGEKTIIPKTDLNDLIATKNTEIVHNAIEPSNYSGAVVDVVDINDFNPLTIAPDADMFVNEYGNYLKTSPEFPVDSQFGLDMSQKNDIFMNDLKTDNDPNFKISSSHAGNSNFMHEKDVNMDSIGSKSVSVVSKHDSNIIANNAESIENANNYEFYLNNYEVTPSSSKFNHETENKSDHDVDSAHNDNNNFHTVVPIVVASSSNSSTYRTQSNPLILDINNNANNNGYSFQNDPMDGDLQNFKEDQSSQLTKDIQPQLIHTPILNLAPAEVHNLESKTEFEPISDDDDRNYFSPTQQQQALPHAIILPIPSPMMHDINDHAHDHAAMFPIPSEIKTESPIANQNSKEDWSSAVTPEPRQRGQELEDKQDFSMVGSTMAVSGIAATVLSSGRRAAVAVYSDDVYFPNTNKRTIDVKSKTASENIADLQKDTTSANDIQNDKSLTAKTLEVDDLPFVTGTAPVDEHINVHPISAVLTTTHTFFSGTKEAPQHEKQLNSSFTAHDAESKTFNVSENDPHLPANLHDMSFIPPSRQPPIFLQGIALTSSFHAEAGSKEAEEVKPAVSLFENDTIVTNVEHIVEANSSKTPGFGLTHGNESASDRIPADLLHDAANPERPVDTVVTDQPNSVSKDSQPDIHSSDEVPSPLVVPAANTLSVASSDKPPLQIANSSATPPPTQINLDSLLSFEEVIRLLTMIAPPDAHLLNMADENYHSLRAQISQNKNHFLEETSSYNNSNRGAADPSRSAHVIGKPSESNAAVPQQVQIKRPDSSTESPERLSGAASRPASPEIAEFKDDELPKSCVDIFLEVVFCKRVSSRPPSSTSHNEGAGVNAAVTSDENKVSTVNFHNAAQNNKNNQQPITITKHEKVQNFDARKELENTFLTQFLVPSQIKDLPHLMEGERLQLMTWNLFSFDPDNQIHNSIVNSILTSFTANAELCFSSAVDFYVSTHFESGAQIPESIFNIVAESVQHRQKELLTAIHHPSSVPSQDPLIKTVQKRKHFSLLSLLLIVGLIQGEESPRYQQISLNDLDTITLSDLLPQSISSKIPPVLQRLNAGELPCRTRMVWFLLDFLSLLDDDHPLKVVGIMDVFNELSSHAIYVLQSGFISPLSVIYTSVLAAVEALFVAGCTEFLQQWIASNGNHPTKEENTKKKASSKYLKISNAQATLHFSSMSSSTPSSCQSAILNQVKKMMLSHSESMIARGFPLLPPSALPSSFTSKSTVTKMITSTASVFDAGDGYGWLTHLMISGKCRSQSSGHCAMLKLQRQQDQQRLSHSLNFHKLGEAMSCSCLGWTLLRQPRDICGLYSSASAKQLASQEVDQTMPF